MSDRDDRKCSVYQIRNTVTGRLYVGCTVNPGSRWKQHRSEMRDGRSSSVDMVLDWIHYGESAFVFEILEVVEQSERVEAEQRWINKLHAECGLWGLYNIDLKVRPGISKRMGPRKTASLASKVPRSEPLWKTNPEAHRKKVLKYAAFRYPHYMARREGRSCIVDKIPTTVERLIACLDAKPERAEE